MPFRRRRPSRALALSPVGSALTASSQRASGLTAQEFRTLFQPWQVTSLATYSSVGECWYAAQFYARSLSKLRLAVGRIDEAGEVKELPPEDDASKLLDRVQDPGGGRAGLLASYGRLMFLVGESYLTVTGEASEDERWEFLSPLELRPVPGGKGFIRQSAPGLTLETLTAAPDDDEEPGAGEAVVWRVWRRHPTYSKWADSPMAAVLLLFEELELLQLAVRARSKARSNRGILYVATEISFASPDGQGDENPEKDTFMEDLSTVLLAPVKDPGAPSSVVPFVIRGPASVPSAGGTGFVGARDLVFTVPLIDPKEQNDEEAAKAAIIKRIAIGLDLPPEILTGMAEVNHWGAWQIDEASWTAHVQPMADQLVGDLSSSYLRPAAKQAGIEGWEDLVVIYDASDVINHPDRTNDVREAYRDGAVGAVTYRATIGLEEEDAPTPEEHQEWLDIKLRGQAQLAEVTGVDPATAEPIDSASTKKVPPTQPTVEQVQDDESVQSLGASGRELELRVQRIVGAAELAVERTREIAGSRLINRAQGCDDCKEKIVSVPSSMVASALGQEESARLAPGVILTEGGTASFAATLGRMGVDSPVVTKLSQLVETHARESLFEAEPRALPDKFIDYVRRVA